LSYVTKLATLGPNSTFILPSALIKMSTITKYLIITAADAYEAVVRVFATAGTDSMTKSGGLSGSVFTMTLCLFKLFNLFSVLGDLTTLIL
jgi:hypothetical protein